MTYTVYTVATPSITPQELLAHAKACGLTSDKLACRFTHAVSATSKDNNATDVFVKCAQQNYRSLLVRGAMPDNRFLYMAFLKTNEAAELTLNRIIHIPLFEDIHIHRLVL